MKVALILVVTWTLATPAVAGPILWRDIEAGMSAQQVRALYPAKKGEIHHRTNRTIIENVQQVGRCHPDVHVEHPNGVVAKVQIYSRYRGFPKESCGDEAEKAMLGKYGMPGSKDQAEQETGGVISSGFLKGLDTTRTERDTKQNWFKDGVLITFERFDPDIDDTWTIAYEVPQDIGL